MNKSLIATAVLAGVSLISGNNALAQEPAPPAAANQASPDENLQLIRKDLRSLKKQIIAANMDLTDSEAQQFWPIYDQYTAELVTIMDKKYALLNEYAQNYTTMTSEQADTYIKGRAAVEESVMQLRLKYFPIFRKVLSGKSTALFFQMDWRLGLIMDLQLASQTPLIEP
jgi:Spy/CpxP family protein refolding chaperone